MRAIMQQDCMDPNHRSPSGTDPVQGHRVGTFSPSRLFPLALWTVGNKAWLHRYVARSN